MIRYRDEIDGLRAIAVGATILFHIDAPGFSAGFIGVDMFFVISGYLISKLLLAEWTTREAIDLPGFWARRARRLLPAATVVIITTTTAAALLSSPLAWTDLALQAATSSTYVANMHFASETTRYFGATPESSPLLHMWSLSVEEQFYLVWPILFWSLARFKQSLQPLKAFLPVICLISFALSLWLSIRGTPWAFFSVPTRAWQFSVGAMLCVWPIEAGTPRATRLLQWSGMLGLVLALYSIQPGAAYPGTAALMPTLSTAALIAAGRPNTVLTTLLTSRPSRAVGMLSYSLYLWHWPALFIVGRLTDNQPGPWALTLAIIVAAVFAALTLRFIEEPIRRNARLAASTRLSLVAGLVAVTVTALLAGALWAAASVAGAEPRLKRLAAMRLRDADLQADCSVLDVKHLLEHCTVGGSQHEKILLVAGDSHAWHWLPALGPAGDRLGLRVIYSGRGGCPSIPALIAKRGVQGRSPACEKWQHGFPTLLKQFNPAAVVLSNSAGHVSQMITPDGRYMTESEAIRAWADALSDLLEQLHNSATPVVVFHDTPALPRDPIECLAYEASAADCEWPLDSLLAQRPALAAAVDAAIQERGHGTSFEPTSLVCPRGLCAAADESGTPAFSDGGHISPAFAARFSKPMDLVIQEAMNKAPRRGPNSSP